MDFGTFLVALTVKQRRFAWYVASGESKTKSYAKAYNSRGNANTQGKNGHVLSRKPAIAAAIAQYEAQILHFEDIRAEKVNALQNLRALALSPSVGDKIRLEASVALLEFCEKCERAAAGGLPDRA